LAYQALFSSLAGDHRPAS